MGGYADTTELIATNDMRPGRGEVVALLMSGGVDSSTSAHILKEKGYAVVGVTMQIRRTEDGKPARATVDAAEVCRKLGIPHCWTNLSKAFEEMVVEKFRQAYAEGRTPNPCVDCNINIKFGLLWELAQARFGATKVATGHYARIIRDGGDCRLARAKDKAKDQSYFLSGIAREKLASIIFPLGELTKNEVREMAKGIGLHVADKTESMELCFAGEGDYRAMLGIEHASNEGDLLNMAGEKIGTHKGIANYTLGQRRGLGFAGGEPLYVGAIDSVRNTVTLGTRADLCRQVVEAEQLNVLIPERYIAGVKGLGKVRSYGDGRPCEITVAAPDRLVVRFEEPEFAPCPGQRLVVYDEAECIIAGGTIVGSKA
jgi:tRNA-uridine 2-sulfurtransferase